MLDKIVDFIWVKDKGIWQSIVLSSLLIPLVFSIFLKLKKWRSDKNPLRVLFRGFLKPEQEILIFLSQLSVADTTYRKINDPKYVAIYPSPTPTDRSRLTSKGYQNIDPVWSESDGRCAADIFNALGNAGKIKNVKIADTKSNWNNHNVPTIGIGFNPKTENLLVDCDPIYFEGYSRSNEADFLAIEGSEKKVDAYHPSDGGIIQKTFFKNSVIPVLILAGLGTMGTEITGYFLNQNALILGRLYGSGPFCVLLKTDVRRGREYSSVEAIYPKPRFVRMILHPITCYKWRNYFPNK